NAALSYHMKTGSVTEVIPSKTADSVTSPPTHISVISALGMILSASTGIHSVGILCSAVSVTSPESSAFRNDTSAILSMDVTTSGSIASTSTVKLSTTSSFTSRVAIVASSVPPLLVKSPTPFNVVYAGISSVTATPLNALLPVLVMVKV